MPSITRPIALATAAAFPDLDEDGPGLLAALGRRGLRGVPVVWTDTSVDWSAYAAVVTRCTWDYPSRRAEFLAWAELVSTCTVLANPADVLRWNTEKTYLRVLSRAGVPVVDTTWLEPGDPFAPPPAGEYVVKPAVSGGARDTNRYAAGSHDAIAARHVAHLHAAGRTVMVQPYLDSVDQHGETAMLYFAGQRSHAVRKGPVLEEAMRSVTGAYKGGQVDSRDASPAERGVADEVLDAVAASDELGNLARGALTYARVDLVPGPDGSPVLLELELTEPAMFLTYDSLAADRFAIAIAALVRR